MILLIVVACAAATPDGLATASIELQRAGAAALPIRATWPEGSQQLPVIVFSHGLGGSREGYAPLAQRWARQGYLVIQPTHPDSLALRPAAERLRLLRDPAAFLKDPSSTAAWDERPAEIGTILDHLAEPSAIGWLIDAGLDPARIDLQRVGIAGHSFGAHTAMLCGGLSLVGIGTRLQEPRVDALVLLSPQGTGAGITAESFRTISVPTLVVTGSEDRSPRTGQGPQWRLEAWQGLTVSDRWLLWLQGASHSLGGIGGRRLGRDSELLEAVLEASTTFWDATLGDHEAARRSLAAGTVTSERARLTSAATPAPQAPAPRASD